MSRTEITLGLAAHIEAVLFAAGTPVRLKTLLKLLAADEAMVREALHALGEKFSAESSGTVLLQTGDEWQLCTNPALAPLVEQFVKAEISGELTKPQLETLTVVAYCGPITKPELEQLRGVNCSIILRHLMMRGLVQESADSSAVLPRYEITMECLRHLGVASVEQLPNYTVLHTHEHIAAALADAGGSGVVGR